MNYFKNKNIHIFSINQNDMEYHSHKFLELVYVMHGKGIHFLDGESSVVKEGDYFIIDYGSRHKYKKFDGEELELVNCLFCPDFIDPLLEKCMSFEEMLSSYMIRFGGAKYCCAPTHCVFRDENGAVRALIMSIMEEYECKRRGADEIMRCRLIELLILTMRKILDGDAAARDRAVSAAVEYINKNYMKQVRLSDISATLGIGSEYLSAKFKRVMGVTFTEYLQKVRIGQSCRLLTVTDKKIIEIAELSGYGDIKFFNSIFKKYMNMTPRKYRAKARS